MYTVSDLSNNSIEIEAISFHHANSQGRQLYGERHNPKLTGRMSMKIEVDNDDMTKVIKVTDYDAINFN